MVSSSTNFNIEDFQKQVVKEIERLSNEPYSVTIFHPPLGFYESELRLSPHNFPSEKPYDEILNELETELEKPLLFWSKRRITKLIGKLRQERHASLRQVNDELKQRLDRVDLMILKIQGRDEQAKRDLSRVLIKTHLRKYLCPALLTASNDAFDIAKIITPILIPLILAGTITMPLEPLLFAHLAVSIARMGIASVCDDFRKEDKK